jgi:hypothetical protein
VLPGLVVGAALVAFAAGALVFGSLAAVGSGHADHGSSTGHESGAAAATELGGLTLQVELGEWVKHDMLGGPTPANAGPFKMPMTGIGNMPAEGNDRFHVEVLIANQGGASQTLSKDEFRLRTSDGRLWSLNQDDQSDQDNQSQKDRARTQRSLAPGQMTDMDLFFDVPEKSGEPLLLWSRAGEQVSIKVGAGAAPPHQH